MTVPLSNLTVPCDGGTRADGARTGSKAVASSSMSMVETRERGGLTFVGDLSLANLADNSFSSLPQQVPLQPRGSICAPSQQPQSSLDNSGDGNASSLDGSVGVLNIIGLGKPRPLAILRKGRKFVAPLPDQRAACAWGITATTGGGSGVVAVLPSTTSGTYFRNVRILFVCRMRTTSSLMWEPTAGVSNAKASSSGSMKEYLRRLLVATLVCEVHSGPKVYYPHCWLVWGPVPLHVPDIIIRAGIPEFQRPEFH